MGWAERGGRRRQSFKRVACRPRIGSADVGQDESVVYALEQLHTEQALERPDLLPYCAGADMELPRCPLEAEVPRRGLERPECVQWGQQVGHGMIRPNA